MDDIEQKIDYIQQLFNKLCQKIKSLEGEIGTGNESLEDLTIQLNAQKNILDSEIAELKAKGTAAAEAAAAELEQQRLSAEESLKQLKKSMSDLEKDNDAKLAALEQEKVKIQSNADERQEQIEQLTQKNTTDQQKIEELESAAIAVSNELEQSRLENITLNGRIYELEDTINKANATNEAKLSRIREKLNDLKICADKIENVPEGDYDGNMVNISYPSIAGTSETVPPRDDDLEPVSSTDTETTGASLDSPRSPDPNRSAGGGRKRKTKRKKSKRKKSKKTRRKFRKRR